MLLPLLIALANAQGQLSMPFFMDFREHISNYFTSKEENNPLSTHNCLIVPCTVVNRQQNCLVITKLSHAGDCFSRYFVDNSTDDKNLDDYLKLEFSLLVAHHPQSKAGNSGITIGFEATSGSNSELLWILAESADKIPDGRQKNYNAVQFVEVNAHPKNTWTKVRVNFKPKFSNSTIRLILEAYDGATDLAGQFLITNLTVFHRGNCSENCATCQSYTECTSCTQGRLYRGHCLTDQCYFDASAFQQSNFGLGWVVEDRQLYGVTIRNALVKECYQVKFIFNNRTTNYIDGSSPHNRIYQYSYQINSTTLKYAGCQFYDKLPLSGNVGYSCYFQFLLSIPKSMVDVIDVSWVQEFIYNSASGTFSSNISSQNIDYQGLTQYDSAGTTSMKVEGQVLLCKTKACRTYYADDEEKNLFLNQDFYVLVKLDENHRDFGADFQFKLTSAFALGYGTMIPMKLNYESEKNMSAHIFGFTVPIVIPDCILQISTVLVERNPPPSLFVEEPPKRRLWESFMGGRQLQESQQQENQNQTGSGYGVSGGIKIGRLEKKPEWWDYKSGNAPIITIAVVSGSVLIIIIVYGVCIARKKKTEETFVILQNQAPDQQQAPR